MKAIILAGGKGIRLGELTEKIPKPMVSVGDRPLLKHLIDHFESYGDFEIGLALGYKGDVIQKAFPDYFYLEADDETQTGGRLLQFRDWIGSETFMMTYGDGLSTIDLNELIDFHKNHGKLATVTAVHPPPRYGELTLADNRVVAFAEKPIHRELWINGGFFVLEPEVFQYIEGKATLFERGPLERLAAQGELMAYSYEGFWRSMDTLYDYQTLNEIWERSDGSWLLQK